MRASETNADRHVNSGRAEGPARWRAYGVLTTLVAPPVLAFLFVVWFFASGGRIGPR